MSDRGNNRCPVPPNGRGTFSRNLVGRQITDGGGLTQGNFEFTNNITEKINRRFSEGNFSKKINLDNISNIEDNKLFKSKELGIYPNFDLSEVTNFSLYGSLKKRLSISIKNIINFFPASLDIDKLFYDFTEDNTAFDIDYDSIENTTTFKINVNRIKNPFDIEYSVNATNNISVRPHDISELRNLPKYFNKYELCVTDINNSYPIIDLTPSQSLDNGVLEITVEGKPFIGSTTEDSLIIKPLSKYVDKSFKHFFDEVEKFLLNRKSSPRYEAKFKIVEEDNQGNLIRNTKKVVWKKDGLWNLDIRTEKFNRYISKINEIAELLDEFKTDLIDRFMVSGSIKDFDTEDKKASKLLQIYGRSFDEIKKFVDSLAFMNSVTYTKKDDIPSRLLKNLSQTLGWGDLTNINNNDFLNQIFSNQSNSNDDMIPEELNFDFYRNLILNSAYLFKSKGTRRSVEFIMRMVGAPKPLIEFNETVYIADAPINYDKFINNIDNISEGKLIIKDLDFFDSINILGVSYPSYDEKIIEINVDSTINDYPIDNDGYPKPIRNNDFMFFQKGAGWYRESLTHSGENIVDDSNFIVSEPFTYGEKYLNTFIDFPYMRLGYNITKQIDNKKSWLETDNLRSYNEKSSNTNYNISDERLVINTKNIDLYLNVGQAISYDVWVGSKNNDYPISNDVLNRPINNSIDSTEIKINSKKLTFAEFYQKIVNNLINARNRKYITDSKGGGYPSLQKVFWDYLNSEDNVGIPNNKYTYQKMIDFTNKIGTKWMKLVEKVLPATTIWMGGQKINNSIFHRQKMVWRRQRGCFLEPVPCKPCIYDDDLFQVDCVKNRYSCDISNINYSIILFNTLNACVNNINNCNLDNLNSNWFITVEKNNEVLDNIKFYEGFGSEDLPNNDILINIFMSNNELIDYGYTVSNEDSEIMLESLFCKTEDTLDDIKISINLDLNIICNA